MTMKTYNPGEKAPVSGQYQNPTTKTEVTVGQGYKLGDPTKHKTQKYPALCAPAAPGGLFCREQKEKL